MAVIGDRTSNAHANSFWIRPVSTTETFSQSPETPHYTAEALEDVGPPFLLLVHNDWRGIFSGPSKWATHPVGGIAGWNLRRGPNGIIIITAAAAISFSDFGPTGATQLPATTLDGSLVDTRHPSGSGREFVDEMGSMAAASTMAVATPFRAAAVENRQSLGAASSWLASLHIQGLSCAVKAADVSGRMAPRRNLSESSSSRINSSPSVVTATTRWSATGTLATGSKSSNADELEVMEPEFYRMGYIRHCRAYGVEFKEGSSGIGVYAAKDIPTLNKARVIMEIPAELMITVSQKLPWLFYPDFLPLGHPLFEIINSTDSETDWDFRLACMLLLALDQDENFWQLYSDYLPGNEDSTSLLLATEEELQELQNENLAEVIRAQRKRVIDFWTENWPSDSVLKLKRLARDSDQFLWAVGVAWSRKFDMNVTIGARTQAVNMLVPYADMLNHSFQPTCSMRWRRRDRMLEVVMNAGQTIKQGDEMTLNYLDCKANDTYMKLYGFSSAQNPWDVVKFSGDAKIHFDSFLSAFDLAGMLDELYYNVEAADAPDAFVDGAVIAAARNLPTWSDGDFPFLPSHEIKAAKALLLECQQHLDTFPTTLEEDRRLYDSESEKRSPRWQAAVRYRMDRKSFIGKIMKALDLYMERILF